MAFRKPLPNWYDSLRNVKVPKGCEIWDFAFRPKNYTSLYKIKSTTVSIQRPPEVWCFRYIIICFWVHIPDLSRCLWRSITYRWLMEVCRSGISNTSDEWSLAMSWKTSEPRFTGLVVVFVFFFPLGDSRVFLWGIDLPPCWKFLICRVAGCFLCYVMNAHRKWDEIWNMYCCWVVRYGKNIRPYYSMNPNWCSSFFPIKRRLHVHSTKLDAMIMAQTQTSCFSK